MNSAPPEAEILPPFDEAAEAGGLGCVLCADGKARELLAQLHSEHFYDLRHCVIWRALNRIDSPESTVSLIQYLKDHGWLDDAGGLEYVAGLTERAPTASNFPYWLKTLKDRAARRALHRDFRDADAIALDLSQPLSVAVDAARRISGSYENGSLLLPFDPGTRQFNAEKAPPTLRAIYTLCEKPICTPGNLATITAPIKAGKSATIGAMLAAPMCGNCSERDLLGFSASNPDGLALLHFDSEQPPDDHWWLVSRARQRAGLTDPPPWLLSYCLTGLMADEAWRFVKGAISEAVRIHKGVFAILLDGAADFVNDVNDAGECNAFVAELHGLAIKHDCPIVGVIHFNPGSEKSRGHLGSQLERKAETNLRLEKVGEVTEIFSEKQRRAPIPKGTGPCFQWSNEAGMHVSTVTRRAANDAQKREAEALLVQEVFGDRPAYRYADLKTTLMRVLKKSDATAERKIAEWAKFALISKSFAGLWIKGTNISYPQPSNNPHLTLTEGATIPLPSYPQGHICMARGSEGDGNGEGRVKENLQ